MKKLLIAAILLFLTVTIAQNTAFADGSVTLNVVIVDFCGPGPARGIVEVRGVDYVTGTVSVKMTLALGFGIVEDVEGVVGEGGPGDYGFEYVDTLEETEVVFISASYQSIEGYYESEVVSFFLDELCNGVVPTNSVYIVPTGVVATLPSSR